MVPRCWIYSAIYKNESDTDDIYEVLQWKILRGGIVQRAKVSTVFYMTWMLVTAVCFIHKCSGDLKVYSIVHFFLLNFSALEVVL